MQIESIQSDGQHVNCWSLVALPPVIDEKGQEQPGGYEPRCVENALLVNHPDAAMAAARNAAIAEGAATPDAVEARAAELLPTISLPVSRYIQDWQFAHAVRTAMPDKMTEQEAEDWSARGILPQVMVDIVNSLPAEMKALARLKLASTKQYDRNDPLVAMVGGFLKISPQEIDGLWRLAHSL